MISKRKRNTILVYCMASGIMLLSLISNITEVTTQLSNSKREVTENQVINDNVISYGLVAIEASSSIEKNDAKIDTEKEKEEIKSEKTSDKKKSSKKKTKKSTKKVAQKVSTVKKVDTVKKTSKPVKLPSNKELGKQIAAYAKQFVGNPYKRGGTSLTKGADCSGFTQSVFKHFGIKLSRTAASQSSHGVKVPYSKLEPGDLIFYNTNGRGISHVAIYIGNNKIVHAQTPKDGIGIDNMNVMTKVTARRVVK